jgi:cellulose synthase/poly-beta-1,6-N-acetylglucosamine synthase-like glycosyltransferase
VPVWVRSARAAVVADDGGDCRPLDGDPEARRRQQAPLADRLCLVSAVVARPPGRTVSTDRVRVSVVVPCLNERGSVAAAVDRMPRLGAHTEVLFCDDRSSDGTADEVRRVQALRRDRDIRLVVGPRTAKVENVRRGFRACRGDILIIPDGDLTVMPDELPAFVDALTEGRADLANGSWLVYPMAKSAMPLSHVVGNR